MLLSGGTTSLSKLIPRTHEDYVLNARLCGAAAGFDAATELLVLLPLGHNYNLASPGMLGAFHAGGTVVLGDGMDAGQRLRAGGARKGHAHPGGGAAHLRLARLRRRPALRPVVAAGGENGGARLAPELRARLRERFGCTPQEVYGTAEGLINMVRLDDPDALLLESSGAPVCRRRRDQGGRRRRREVADGEPGRAPHARAVHHPRLLPRGGEERARRSRADGFYRMGDIVRREGRHVYAEGRRKDLINRGGEKISCDEVENLIYMHPDGEGRRAGGDARPGVRGEGVRVRRAEAGRDADLRRADRVPQTQKIAAFKLPERLEVVDALPLSPVGKILKRELRERITATLAREARERQAA